MVQQKVILSDQISGKGQYSKTENIQTVTSVLQTNPTEQNKTTHPVMPTNAEWILDFHSCQTEMKCSSPPVREVSDKTRQRARYHPCQLVMNPLTFWCKDPMGSLEFHHNLAVTWCFPVPSGVISEEDQCKSEILHCLVLMRPHHHHRGISRMRLAKAKWGAQTRCSYFFHPKRTSRDLMGSMNSHSYSAVTLTHFLEFQRRPQGDLYHIYHHLAVGSLCLLLPLLEKCQRKPSKTGLNKIQNLIT